MDISKGFEVFAYVETSDAEIEFKIEKDSVVARVPGEMFQRGMDMTLYFAKDNELNIDAKSENQTQASRYVKGVLLPVPHFPNNFGKDYPGAVGSTISSLEGLRGIEVPASERCATDFGLYLADAAVGGLPDTVQVYAYCTSPKDNWMAELISELPDSGSKPFARFVLPGAHDAGMNDVRHLYARWPNIAPKIPVGGVYFYIVTIGILAIPVFCAFAMTQRHSFSEMLSLGTRYFDFRPGYDYGTFPTDELYHQHSFIPGSSFTDFLNETVRFLEDHPGEIVVVSLSFDGFDNDDMKPSAQVLETRIEDALKGSNVCRATIKDMKSSYDDLIDSDKRLFFLNSPAVGFDEAPNSNSYNDPDYATFDVSSILKAIEKVPHSPPGGKDYTVLQLQGTPTALWKDYVTAIPRMAFTPWTSPLFVTKPRFDHSTYQWVAQNGANFDVDTSLVILNDFVDPALSAIARSVTRERLKKP